MRIVLGSDHGGLDTKKVVLAALAQRGIDTEDVGCFTKESVDYPDFAQEVVTRVLGGRAEQGILVCTTGIGMSMAANRFTGIRAALCLTPDMAVKARSHNDANVLVLGGGLATPEQAVTILDSWLKTQSPSEVRHKRRVSKINVALAQAAEMAPVASDDPEIFAAIENEIERQQQTINLIASENHVSPAVRLAQGSVLTNKYAEGYPGKRWYNGCQFVDEAERLAIDRCKKLFGAEHANVQPHCGSSANMAVYFAALKPGDTILAMRLAHGGHLTHGSEVNFSGRLFDIVPYGVSEKDELIDFDAVARLARERRPKLIVAGASAYPRVLDFPRFAEIARSVGALLMVDMAHIAGLVAAGVHPSPVPYSAYVTSTTHKTLRGPRSGLVLCRDIYGAELDKQVFPGIQGGPLMHTVAAKAVCFHEALRPEFKEYGRQIVANAKAMADVFASSGFKLVSGGTDNHLMLLNLDAAGLTGKDAAEALDKAGIIVNKNSIPFDKRSPFVTSGIRIGTPAATTRGMKEPAMRQVATLIVDVLRHIGDEKTIKKTHDAVLELGADFPAP